MKPKDPGGVVTEPLSQQSMLKLNAYWRAANCLSVGQNYLYDNPLVKEPLRPEHVKRRWSAIGAIGADVTAQMENDLAAEKEAVGQYNTAVATCLEAGDNASRALFERMVADEEKHTDYLESQLFMIGELGLDNYLAQQIHGE